MLVLGIVMLMVRKSKLNLATFMEDGVGEHERREDDP